MSTRTEDREVKMKASVIVFVCDGPDCARTVEVGSLRSTPVPPGWIAVTDSTAPAGKRERHYCGRDCLADAVVP